MSFSLANGSIISIASGYGAAIVMSALSNAVEAVATLANGHGVAVGDILELTSGWSRTNARVVRVKAVNVNAVTLEGIDTSSAARYPAGGGIGSVRKITGWVQLSQIMEWGSQGGDQQYATIDFLEEDFQRQAPTTKTARSYNASMADDQSLPWYAALSAADEDRSQRSLRIQLANGAQLFSSVLVGFNKTPSLTKNEVMALAASFSLQGEVTRYAAAA